MTTSSRLLELLGLLQTPRDWTGTELAARLEVSTRTVRKDVERLRDLGYPIAGLPGVTGGYRLRPGARLPPLLLDDEEVVAVVLGLYAEASGGVAGLEEMSLRALSKITNLLPTRLRRRVETLQQSSVLLPNPGGPRVDLDLLQDVARACREREGLRFDYAGADRTTSLRRAEPFQLVHRRHRWYLLAFDLDRDDWRTFRLDRITLRTPGGARFSPRPIPGGDAGAYVQESIGALTHRYTATVRLMAPYHEVAVWFQPGWGDLQPVDDRTCLLRAASDSYESLTLGLGLAGLEFEVLDPPELRDYLAAMAARFAQAASAPV